MSFRPFRALWRALRWLILLPLRLVEFLGRIAIGLAVLVFVAALLISQWEPVLKLPPRFVLTLALDGDLVEQPPLPDGLRSLRSLEPGPAPLVLRDVLDALDRARRDERVLAVALDLSRLGGASFAQIEELRGAIARLRQAGKPVYAYGDVLPQKAYYLAAAAQEVTLDPEGMVLLPGVAVTQNYFRDAFDRLGVRVHAFRVGKHKSFVEPFTRNDMSPEEREVTQDLIGGIWQRLLDDLARDRSLAPAVLRRYSERYDEVLAAHEGDSAKAAQAERLVDQLQGYEDWHDGLLERYGREGNQAEEVAFDDYLYATAPALPAAKAPVVALLPIQGTLIDGPPRDGMASADSIVDRLDEAAEDETIKAVVLRLDTPGGSAFAAERIRRAVLRVKAAGKPVIVSMSGTAASGGYWIASAADEIFADRFTLTGSIGIFALFPEAAGLLDKLSVHTDGVKTGPFADGLDPRVPLADPVARAVQAEIEHGYRRFLAVVSEGRKIPETEVDPIAQGRVWLGETGQKLGLVDTLGGLDAALDRARDRAKLPQAPARWLLPPLSARDVLMKLLFEGRSDEFDSRLQSLGLLPPGVSLAEPRRLLSAFADRRGLYAHCLCAAP